MWGQVGSWAPILSHGLVFPPPRTIFFIVLFSQYLKDIPVPLPSYQRGKKCHFSPVYLFQIFPVRLGSWSPVWRGGGTSLTQPRLLGLFPLASRGLNTSWHRLCCEGAAGRRFPLPCSRGGREGWAPCCAVPLPPSHVHAHTCMGKGLDSSQTLPDLTSDAGVP